MKNGHKILVTTFAAVSLLFLVLGLRPLPAEAQSYESLLSQIVKLQKLIAELQSSQQTSLATVTSGQNMPYTCRFDTDLRMGSVSDAVLNLQRFLNTSIDTRVAEDGVGAPGRETAIFGLLTQKAVSRFQAKYANEILDPAQLRTPTGYWGVRSRAKALSLCRSLPVETSTSSEASTTSSTTIPVRKKSRSSSSREVVVTTPTLSSLSISPASVTLDIADTQQFTVSGLMSDGSSTSSPSVTWSATGGSISSNGLYTASSTDGSYSVTVTNVATGIGTSSAVVINPATLASLAVSPTSASLQVQRTQQFTVSGLMSDGSSTSSPSVTWSATGGSISSNGLYTAADVSGSYLVTATGSGGVTATSSVTLSEESWYIGFSQYATGSRPSDFRKHRNIGDYDLIVRDDATFEGGKKLKLEGTSGASRVMALDFVPQSGYQEVVLSLVQAGSAQVAVGGAVVGATTEDMNGGSNISEHGARIVYQSGRWEFAPWRYDQGAFTSLSSDISSWYSPGVKVRIRIRRDPNDTNGGANPLGTVRARIWKDGDPEPSTWSFGSLPITSTTPAGVAGIYANTVTGGAEYDWIGVSTNSSIAAPMPEDNHPAHTPTAVSSPSLSGFDYVEDFSGDTVGTLPTEWTPHYQTGTAWLVKSEPSSDDGRTLYGTRSSTSRAHLKYVPMGTVANAHILAKFRVGSTQSSNGDGGLSVRQAGANTAVNYDIRTGGVGRTVFNSGTFSANSSVSFAKDALTGGEWVWMRVRVEGDTTKVKVWRTSELEPNAWVQTSTGTNAITATGGVGLYNYEGSYHEVDVFAVEPL